MFQLSVRENQIKLHQESTTFGYKTVTVSNYIDDKFGDEFSFDIKFEIVAER